MVTELKVAEYHESANAYFKGVDIGYTTFKNYISINGLCVALMGLVAGASSPALESMSKLILLAAPILAIIFSLVLAFAIPHYFRHLENCRMRCQEIEDMFDGKLFTRLGAIAHKEGVFSFNTDKGLVLIMLVVIGLWLTLIFFMNLKGLI